MITNIQTPHINYADRNKLAKNQSFKGAEVLVQGLRFLNNSPAVGACAVDLGSMVIPRTAVDTKKRGIDAGIETGIREGSSTTNHAIVGLVGLGAATIASQGINAKYGIKANRIFANNDAIDVFGSFWKGVDNNHPEKSKEYFKSVLSKMEGLNGSDWTSIKDEKLINEIAEKLENFTKSDDKIKTLPKEVKNEIVARIIKATGAENEFKIAKAGEEALQTGKKEVANSIDVLVDNMASLGKAFASKSVDNIDNFAKELKHVKTASALLGLATTCSIGCSIQPFNTYLTKKRTGKEGFVGVEGKEADKSAGFKFMKLGAAAVMGLFGFSQISKKPSEILNKIQFSSMLPNLNQFKMIYTMTIMSRFLSARDKNELRESTIKDSLGFANWLILGGMVSKLVARKIGGKDLINNPIVNEGAKEAKKGMKYAWNWITKVSVKSYDQVLLEGIKNADDIVKSGKVLGFKDLWKIADKASKAKVGKLAIAQIVGYLYSGVVLGFGIAKLNIFITGKVQKNQKGKQQSQNNQVQVASPDDAKVKFYAQNSTKLNEIFAKIKEIV